MGSSVELVGAWVDCAGLWRRVGVIASVFGRQAAWRLGILNGGVCQAAWQRLLWHLVVKLLGGWANLITGSLLESALRHQAAFPEPGLNLWWLAMKAWVVKLLTVRMSGNDE